MTDEEMTEAYLEDDSKWLIEDCEGNLINITKKVKEAFLAGRRAGWHDLRKNPDDLPADHRFVWTNVGAGHYANSDWWSPFVGRLPNVIAWCEPKFKEESR